MNAQYDSKAQSYCGSSSFAPVCIGVKCLLIVLILAGCNTAFGQDPTDGNKPADVPAAKSAPAPDANPATPSATDELSVEQARLADRYKRLEEVVSRLAELSAGNDPRRAKLLREAIAQSREQDINVRFESIVKLLQDERLSAATTNQGDLQKELDGLLTLLLKADRDKELYSERERVKAYLKEVGRLIREQKGVRARTEGGDDLKGLGADQKRIATDTGKLGGSISKSNGDKKDSDSKEGQADKDGEDQGEKGSKPSDSKNSKPDDKQKPDGGKSDKPSEKGDPSQGSESKPREGQPSEGQPGQPSKSQPSQGRPGSQGQPGGEGQKSEQQQQDPADRATDRLKKAAQQMQEAQKKLEDAKRKGATENQQQAIKELEQAKAELERVLRQLREEELERTLTQLAARFRKMLEMQTAVYDGTVRLDRVPVTARTHDHEIDAAKLSRDESQIVHEVDKALSLLREEGSSVAFPETVEQMRDDMRLVTERLAVVKVDSITQDIEKDIIEALEETISALDQSIKDLEQKKTQPGQQPQAGQPGDMPLVDKLAELKMIRSLQMRILDRTRRFGRMIQGEQAETPDLLKSLRELADRQQRVQKATADLQQERND